MIESLSEDCGSGAQLFGVLLGGGDADAEDFGTIEQATDIPHNPLLFRLHGEKTILHVDHQQPVSVGFISSGLRGMAELLRVECGGFSEVTGEPER